MSPTLKRKAATQFGSSDPKKPKANSSITAFFSAPKVSSSSSSSTTGTDAAPKFDKQKWASTLTPEQQSLLKLEIDTLHESWFMHLKDELVSREFLELKRFLERETDAKRKWFPPAEDVYSWSRHTPFHTVKVVILGQDPYHNVNQAHGLAFSVRPPTPAPPSLKNMYIALQNDYPLFNPPPNRGGLLTPWADRGVLMLNTCLTVRAHEANSHANRGWEKFTQKIIDLVAAKRTRGVVFMAWGTPAGKRVQKVDAKRHLVLRAVHPSPLSAARGYYTCGHYKGANEWLATRYGEDGVVDWALTPGGSIFPKKKADGDETEDEGEQKKVEGEVEEEKVDGGIAKKVLVAVARGVDANELKSQVVDNNKKTGTGTGTVRKMDEVDENDIPTEEDLQDDEYP
ncbi:uracil-DNA glycosylase [Diplogelasinospora grovesii]|uniref:Uracil-DNA glycosylase n=1 Tax=Diplogelasinospora grovesii TaxID=303347 RepID=A0AAN6S409_9PEZI|nr:uracil-DNA glycosylase [Diplogelasinospora grovesii]